MTDSTTADPQLRPPAPKASKRQWMIAAGFLVVLIVAIVLAVVLPGDGGTSIHPSPAPAASPTATADVTSRAP